MPRQRGGGRPARHPVRTASAPVRSAPPPAPVSHAPPPAPTQGGGGSMLGGIGSTIAEGMAFGTGSAIAHRVVDGFMGPRTVTHEHVNIEASSTQAAPLNNPIAASGFDACANHAKAFQDCINANDSDISKCQFYVDMLNQCRRGSPSVSL
ncbi:hypothetical protein KP509_36G026100 [Ceratopteris richardii]|uniref:CHCH domain-containing protein n=1 Tax=Ceratopteris richardii TaxID=49495 RepID=A0A8T2QBF4_CERRI|nr:hypothetical protein KP509_36G026100 [Ceratopteris richardii]KAH7281025.1 hypothetical protein KP509_36G026100 [Ceratopteris richardii]